MITAALEELGLTPAEAKAYLVLLENGPLRTGRIIKLSKLQSSTIYHALDSLSHKGLVTHVLVGKIKTFRSQQPEVFRQFMRERLEDFEEILPELKRLEQRQGEQKSARVYEGMRGLKNAYQDVLDTMRPGEDYCFFQMAAPKLAQKEVQMFFRAYHMRRDAQGVRVRGLGTLDTRDSMLAIFKGLRHARVGLVHDFLPAGIVVYKDRMFTIDWQSSEPVVFWVQSREIADSYRKFFDQKWESAKKLKT